MKIVRLEVEIHLPDAMDSANVSEGIDHMLDAAGALMVDVVFQCAKHPMIDPAVAADCVQWTVADSTVVEILENQPEHPEPPRKLAYLPRLDLEYLLPGIAAALE